MIEDKSGKAKNIMNKQTLMTLMITTLVNLDEDDAEYGEGSKDHEVVYE